MKKILLSLLTGLLILPSISLSQSPQKELKRKPSDFYRKEQYVLSISNCFVFGKEMFLVYYDTDKDKIPEIEEFYEPNHSEPKFYWFDFNRNLKAEDEEVFIDEQMDGLNGNEISWAERYIKRWV